MQSRIAQLRKIVDECQAAKVDGCKIDFTTASMLVTVHDALKPENQARFDSLDLMRLIDFGWSMVK